MRKAVIDVGSNSVLLAVEESVDGKWRKIDENSEVTRLGENTKATKLLSARGMQETLEALRRAFDRARSHDCDEIIAGVTMAARIATNTPEFLTMAEAQGTPVVVVSGDDEAELGFRAVANDPRFEESRRISIVDIGGQSTELVTAAKTVDGWDREFRRSFSIGTLALRGGILAEERMNPGQTLRAIATIDQLIGPASTMPPSGHAVCLGATGTNLITIREGITKWDPERVHGAWLDYEEVSKAVSWLGSMTDAERRAIPGMEPGREQTLHIGALILERFLFAIGAPGCSVSVRGWRHALLEEGFPSHGAES